MNYVQVPGTCNTQSASSKVRLKALGQAICIGTTSGQARVLQPGLYQPATNKTACAPVVQTNEDFAKLWRTHFNAVWSSFLEFKRTYHHFAKRLPVQLVCRYHVCGVECQFFRASKTNFQSNSIANGSAVQPRTTSQSHPSLPSRSLDNCRGVNSYHGLKDIGRAACTCKTLKKAFEQEEDLWKPHCIHDFLIDAPIGPFNKALGDPRFA
jgi:hypothetical protein